MKNIKLLLVLLGFGVIILNIQSCSTRQGMVSCPDLHRTSHHQMAMHKTHHSENRNVVAQQSAKEERHNEVGTTKTNQPNTAGTIEPIGTASVSSGMPAIKKPADIFKILTTQERQQVKDKVSTMFSKTPMLKKIVLKKMDRLDKKYPAPAQSVLARDGGGEFTTGEILAIVAIACVLVFGIVGLIIGIIALIKINHDGGREWARILAIVAIVLGALAFLGFLGFFVFIR